MAATSAPAIPGIQEPRTVPRRSLILVAAAGIAASAFLLAVAYANFYDLEDPDHSSHWVRVAQFLLWVAVGEIAWTRRPANPLGRWMIAVGFVGLVVNTLWLAPVALTWTLSLLLANVQITLVAYVFLSFPDGRLRARADRVLMAVIVAFTTVWQLVLVAIEPIDLNLLNVTRDESIQSIVWGITDTTTVILTLAAMARVVVHWRKAPPAGRRVLTPILVALVPYLVVLALQRLAPFVPQNIVTDSALSWGGAVVPGFALPIGFLVGILRTQLARSVVGDVVRELDAGVEPGRLVGVLQRALGDPSLQLAYRLPDGSFVDAGGQPVALPTPGSDRSVTPLGRGGEATEVLIHDPSVDTDPELVAGVAAAARLALENERLHAEVRAQLEEVRASRTRIVEAGLDARRKVERDLHDGAQQQLLALSVRLQMARGAASGDPGLEAMLTTVGRDLDTAIAELRGLARGIHPTVLSELGLGAAVENLADRAAIPVEVTVSVERCSDVCEATAYFVVSEALANISRHAEARHATIGIERAGDDLRVEISDDGIGGADLAAGSGLRGLTDRVAAVGGTLTIDSPEGVGTRLLARIPCA